MATDVYANDWVNVVTGEPMRPTTHDATAACVKAAEDRMYAKYAAHAIVSTSAYWQHGKCHAGNGDEFVGNVECLIGETGSTLYVSWGSTARSRAEVMHQLASIGVTVTGPGRFSREIDTPPWKRKGWDARAELDKAEANKAAGYERMEIERLKTRVAMVERDNLQLERERDEVARELGGVDRARAALKEEIGRLLFEAARRTDELRELQAEIAALRAKHLIPAPDPKPLPAVKAISRAWGLR